MSTQQPGFTQPHTLLSLRVGIANSFRRSYRFVRLVTHIGVGLGTIGMFFPRYSTAQRQCKIKRWSCKLNQVLGIKVITFGKPPGCSDQTLLLSNHISWFDVFAINSVSTARFVAKSEVKNWPLVGHLCKGSGTLFVERDRKQDALRANLEIKTALQAGQQVAIFPEGTTSNGMSLKPFRSALLQPAIDCQAPIQPIYLRYLGADGQQSTAAAYIDDISFGASLWKLLGTKDLSIELHYLPLQPVGENMDRRTLTRQLESVIRSHHFSLNHPASDRPVTQELETVSHLRSELH